MLYTIIPGNYITGWLNEFSRKVNIEHWERIHKDTWNHLVTISKNNKVKMAVKVDSNATFKCFYLYFPQGLNNIYIPNQEKTFGQIINDFIEAHSSTLNLESTIHLTPEYIPNIDEIKAGFTINYTTDENPSILINNNEIKDKEIIKECMEIFPVNNTVSSTITNDNYYTYSVIDTTTSQIEKLKSELEQLKTKKEKKDEKKMNTNDIFNFDFGPITDDSIHMSIYGFAIQNENNVYVAYDIKTHKIMNVEILNFNGNGMFYKIPKPISKIAIGDVVFHNGTPMFINNVSEDHTKLCVIDPYEGTEKTILPAHSPFGFDYVSALISLMDGFNMPASEDAPFGNMLPLIFMNNSKSTDNMLPLLCLMNGKMDFENPLMLLMLSGNTNLNSNNPLAMMAMMKMFNK